MAIKVGDRVPNAMLTHMTKEGPQPIETEAIFSGKRVVLFGLPGAFTPTCSAAHLPGFVVRSDEILAKGIDRIVCVSVNDAFVMDAWGKAHNAEGKVAMMADGNGDFARAVGLELDLRARGMGIRSQRYAMIVNDGKVEHLNVEAAPPKLEVSDAATVLRLLG